LTGTLFSADPVVAKRARVDGGVDRLPGPFVLVQAEA
jgi:hypothetical protein